LKKPSPTVNKAVRKKGKLSMAAGTNIKEPNAESNKPDNVFCIQISVKHQL
jgi:hypothetical protein